MLETPTASVASIEAIVRDLDVLIRARYPLLGVTTFEEGRFRRLMRAVAGLERHKPKGLFVWSRTQGLRQVAGPNMTIAERPVPGAEDPISVLEHIAQAEAGLYILCDFGAYLVPDGLPDPLLVRQLRELAWTIKARPVTVLFVGPTFPDIPALEKEVKTIDLPLPDEREVAAILDLQLDRLASLPDVRLQVNVQTREQLVSALLGLTETEIENALAKAAITRRGIDTDAIPLILDEKRSVIRQTGALTYSHPESVDHLGGYAHLRGLLREAAATFSPAARAFGVEPHKGLLLVGLPGCGKDLCAKVAASVLGRPLLNLDMAAVMGEGGGIIGSAATSIRRALSIATTLKGILGLAEFEKGMGGLQSSARSDGGETARTIGFLLSWMQEQQDVFVFATANDVRQLAPEQIRQGRFGHIVFVDLPTLEDRAAIFSVHLARRGRDPEAFGLEELAATAEGFSGAEIEAAVKAALLDAFLDGARQLTSDDVLRRVRSIRPTSESKARGHRRAAPLGPGAPGHRRGAWPVRYRRALPRVLRKREAGRIVSKYLAYPQIIFKSRELLLGALADLGYTLVEDGEALPLYGYLGDRRPETAALVVRRQHIGSGSNDLGFARSGDGYFPIISDFDRRTLLGGQFLPRLRVAYAERVVETVRKRLRASVRRTTEGSVVKLRVRY